MPAGGWVVARTKVNRELWAAENVQRQGYEWYFPKRLILRNGRARGEPLFACYLFVRTPGPWKFLLGTFGVINVVVFGEQPAFVPEHEIDNFRNRERDGFVVLPKPGEIPERFRRGARVRVTDGAFSGYNGVYDGMDPKQRERVLLEFLGRKVPVLLTPEMVEAL